MENIATIEMTTENTKKNNIFKVDKVDKIITKWPGKWQKEYSSRKQKEDKAQIDKSKPSKLRRDPTQPFGHDYMFKLNIVWIKN